MSDQMFFEGTPEVCYAIHNVTGDAIYIIRGELGYHRATIPADCVDEFNKRLGVTPAQREAMIIGSMFGWHVPAANPAMHAENGKRKNQ